MKRSPLEATFETHLRAHEIIGWEPEFRFATEIGRQWRFDYAWPAQKIAVEIEGGIWGKRCTICKKFIAQGRHTTGQGFEEDAEKYNAATLLGWRLLRFTRKSVKSGDAAAMVRRMLRDDGDAQGVQQPLELVEEAPF